jgi:hypothetical protein
MQETKSNSELFHELETTKDLYDPIYYYVIAMLFFLVPLPTPFGKKSMYLSLKRSIAH